VPFFNQPFLANTAAARLAIHANCDLVPIRCERLPGMRYRITVCKPISSSDRSNSKTNQIAEITAAMVAVYQSWIQEDPAQWMCFSRRWAKRS
jgi:lauroyl/myristoyl acyltransferase